MNRAGARVGSVFLIALICVVYCRPSVAQNLRPALEMGRLRVTAPQLHFLTGRALEKLQNGASVTYKFELTMRAEPSGRVMKRVSQRITVSYDLWEEKFAVATLESPTRSASNISLASAQAWCLDTLSLAVGDIASEERFWLRLEFETEEAKSATEDSSGLTLSGLIDIFSRRSRDEQVRGYDETGPFRLSQLRRK